MQEYAFTHIRQAFTGFSDFRDFMIDGRRLNVALTRQEESKHQRNIQMKEEILPLEAEPDVEIIEDSMDSIGKLSQLLLQ